MASQLANELCCVKQCWGRCVYEQNNIGIKQPKERSLLVMSFIICRFKEQLLSIKVLSSNKKPWDRNHVPLGYFGCISGEKSFSRKAVIRDPRSVLVFYCLYNFTIKFEFFSILNLIQLIKWRKLFQNYKDLSEVWTNNLLMITQES